MRRRIIGVTDYRPPNSYKITFLWPNGKTQKIAYETRLLADAVRLAANIQRVISQKPWRRQWRGKRLPKPRSKKLGALLLGEVAGHGSLNVAYLAGKI
jgi:hypothetical protein